MDGQLVGWLVGWMDGQIDGQTDRQTENLPILQEFVPYWGHCSKRLKILVSYFAAPEKFFTSVIWLLGSAPDRGQCPVEQGDFLSIRLFFLSSRE